MRTLAPVMGLLVGALAGLPARAQTPFDDAPATVAHTRSELLAEPAWAQPGVPFTVAIRQQLDPDWHTYWRQPGDSGRPLQVTWRLPAGWSAGPLQWPAPETVSPPPVVTYGYAGDVWFLAELTPPADASPGSATLAAELDWLVCQEECQLGRTTVTLPLAVKAAPAPAADPRFAAARDALPRPLPAGWAVAPRPAADGTILELTPGVLPAGWSGLAPDRIRFFPGAAGWLDPDRPVQWTRRADGTLSATLPRLAKSATAAWPGGVLTAWQDAAGRPIAVELAGGTAAAPGPAAAAVSGNALAAADWATAAATFQVAARASGYLEAKPFLAFLDQARAGGERTGAEPGLERLTLWALLLAVLAGGLALNLTPCVLPMIPVTLAIIGAGARAGGPRRHGFLVGTAYGAGLTLAYGALGVAAVLTGARFGGLNASPWFNGAMALLFALLALAMAGVFNLDFTRFRRGGPVRDTAGAARPLAARAGLAFVLGLVAAPLAGACVAPVVVAVLLLAGRLHAAGNPAGLLLPFLLGLGMALPWPLAGAGLGLLPKPGRWMQGVKYGFAVLILGLAGYYGHLAWTLARGPAGQAAGAAATPNLALADGLRRARAEHKPLVVDFWATWCKNCLAMDATTFRDPAVRQRLERDFIVVKYQAEQPDRPPAKTVLDHFAVPGLPTYLILQPQ
ncbi:MAG: protein-disulfide reductase DsbD domain-containing protein [Lentisphaeria bacterium]